MSEVFIDPVFKAPARQTVQDSTDGAYKILFVGNSITRHGILQELNWNCEAGMAASAEENDYVHQTGKLISNELPGRKVEVYCGNVNILLKQTTDDTGVLQLLGDKLPAPDLIVIQTGEHEGPAKSPEEIRYNYEIKIIKPLLRLNAPVIAVGNWEPCNGLPYPAWAKNIENIYREICAEYGIFFVSVEKYAVDPSCRGYGDYDPVRWHPSDKGMAGYAGEILSVFKNCIKDKING